MSLKSDLIKHTVVDVSLICILFFCMIWPVKIRHYVLANWLYLFGVHLAIEDLFEQTHCDRSFTKIHFCCFAIWPINKSDTVCWAYIYRTCGSLCHDWCSIYWFIISFIIKNLSIILYYFMGGSYYSISVCPYLKVIFVY